LQTLLTWKRDDGKQVFSQKHEFSLMLQMLVPIVIFTVAIFLLGLYEASLIFITVFMMWQGKYRFLKSITVSACITASLFFLFEIWFLLPLPKGFIETWLGY